MNIYFEDVSIYTFNHLTDDICKKGKQSRYGIDVCKESKQAEIVNLKGPLYRSTRSNCET